MAGVGKRVAWDEEPLRTALGVETDAAIRAKPGAKKVSKQAVQQARKKRNIPRARIRAIPHEWKPEEDAILGMMPDSWAAKELGLNTGQCMQRRRKLGIPDFRAATCKAVHVDVDRDLIVLLDEQKQDGESRVECAKRILREALQRKKKARHR